MEIWIVNEAIKEGMKKKRIFWDFVNYACLSPSFSSHLLSPLSPFVPEHTHTKCILYLFCTSTLLHFCTFFALLHFGTFPFLPPTLPPSSSLIFFLSFSCFLSQRCPLHCTVSSGVATATLSCTPSAVTAPPLWSIFGREEIAQRCVCACDYVASSVAFASFSLFALCNLCLLVCFPKLFSHSF